MPQKIKSVMYCLHLMNSAMMPDPDLVYHPQRISANEAKKFFEIIIADGRDWKSYMGYPNTRDYAEKCLGVAPGSIALSREETHVKPGDEMLIFKLKYRLPAADMKADAAKQKMLADDDFEILLCSVRKPEND